VGRDLRRRGALLSLLATQIYLNSPEDLMRRRASQTPAPVSNSATRINPGLDIAGAGLRPWHRPTLPGTVQDWAGAVQGALQHTPPGAQNVDAHCVPLVHASPKASGVGVGIGVGVLVGCPKHS